MLSFENREFIDQRPHAGCIYLKYIDAICNIHPIARDQIPSLLTIIDIPAVLDFLHKMAAECINANAALVRQMDEVNSPDAPANVYARRLP